MDTTQFNTILGLFGELKADVKELSKDIEKLRHDLAQLRTEFEDFKIEVREEFAKVREEMATGFAEVRQEAATEYASIRQEMADGFKRQEEISHEILMAMSRPFEVLEKTVAAHKAENDRRFRVLEHKRRLRTD